MNKYWLGAACFAVFTIAACRQTTPGSTQEDEAVVVAAGEQYRRAWLESDTAKALAVISDDILIMAPGIADVRGRDASILRPTNANNPRSLAYGKRHGARL